MNISPPLLRGARWLPLVASAVLAGCAVGPDFQPETPQAPADFAAWHSGSAELLDPRQSAAPTAAPPVSWSMFGDPVLDALEVRALDAN